MGRSLWFSVLMILVLVERWHCFGCLEQERHALLTLKAYIIDPQEESLSSWVAESTLSCCEWESVECNTSTRRVTGLSLNNTFSRIVLDPYFNGSLFVPFEELRTLYLNGNFLSYNGHENEGFKPLSRLRNLEVLDLSENYFNDSILPSLSGLSSLKYLDLSYNKLRRLTHSDGFKILSRLKNLEVLDLSGNHLNDSILPSLSGFSSLKNLNLAWNGLLTHSDGLKILSRLRNLEVLDLSGNYLNDSILPSLSGFSSLKNLNLARNGLDGLTHSDGLGTLSRLRNLEVLDLSYNGFNDSILPSFSGFSSLKNLNLANNQLGGLTHSDGFGGLTGLRNLEVLDLSQNVLNRTIQSLLKLDDMVSLKRLDLSYTGIESFELSQGLSSLSNLEHLFLGDSCLNNNVLQSMGVLASLKVLTLSNSCLKGTLPPQGWCELKNLQELDLSGNQLEGVLPQCLGKLIDLRVLDLSNNKLSGNIASSPLISLTLLSYLSLSTNRFLVPVSFRSFANHSNLKVILCDDNIFLPENETTTWAPKFQLNFFSFSNGTKDNFSVIAFPSFLYYQYDLRIVEISHNNLSGAFPSWLLENNTRLEGLYLSDNSFAGLLKFPSHPHFKLLAIDISNNKIGGQIPPNISSIFPNLKQVRMSGNKFVGNLISHLFRDMDALWLIDLSNNLLSGEMPKYFVTRCASLSVIRLSNNDLSGKLSPIVFNLTKLDSLYLDGNNFVGNIPESSSLMTLYTLDLSDNHFSGYLPRWIGKVTTLLELVMPNNHFHGSIPKEFCQLNNLVYLDISDNNLSGSIPPCSNLFQMAYLYLRRNRLEGSLPRAFLNNSSLITLDLSENSLSGTIPTWISAHSSLTILLLKSNNFQGDIPSQLCQLDCLAMLDISQNNLSGSLPPCLGKINRHETNDLSLNQGFEITVISLSLFVNSTMLPQTRKRLWSPDSPNDNVYRSVDSKQVVEFTTKWNSYSYNVKILSFMSGIDFSCNQLTGEIPPGIGNLSHIHALNLSRNNLSGSIPTMFSNLRQIESLDLSYNNLEGKIPSQLVELNSLAVFTVAHNSLSGTTPERKGQFATFEKSSYEGNPLLCGPPLDNSCNNIGSHFPVPNDPKNQQEEDSWLDMDVFYGSFVASYITILLGILLVLYINPYWRRAWFNLIGMCLTESYYFVVDNFSKPSIFRKM